MQHGTKIIFLGLFLFASSLLFAQPAPGQKAAEIALPDVNGSIKKLSALTGKVILLDFWASWCGPCRKANPDLVRLYAKYKKKGFEIFSVSIDENKAAWKKAIAADKITWTQVNENKGWDGPVATAWKIEQIPASYLLDKTGRIVATDPEMKDIESRVLELLNQ